MSDHSMSDLAGYALSALADQEVAHVRDFGNTDPHAANELAQLEAVVTELALAVPQHPINRGRSAGIRSRLVSKAASSREGRAPVSRKTAEMIRPIRRPESDSAHRALASTAEHPTPKKEAAPRSGNAGRSFAIVAAVVAVVGAAAYGVYALKSGQAEPATTETATDRAVTETRSASHDDLLSKRADSLVAALAQRDTTITSLTSQSTKTIDLINYQSRTPLARVFWDPIAGEWTLRSYSLHAPKPGNVYQLWVISTASATPVSLGAFTPNLDGSFTFRVKYALGSNALSKVAISEEPSNGSAAPSASFVVAGTTR